MVNIAASIAHTSPQAFPPQLHRQSAGPDLPKHFLLQNAVAPAVRDAAAHMRPVGRTLGHEVQSGDHACSRRADATAMQYTMATFGAVCLSNRDKVVRLVQIRSKRDVQKLQGIVRFAQLKQRIDAAVKEQNTVRRTELLRIEHENQRKTVSEHREKRAESKSRVDQSQPQPQPQSQLHKSGKDGPRTMNNIVPFKPKSTGADRKP